MPRDANTPICGTAKIRCVKWAQSNLLKGQIRQGQDIRKLKYGQYINKDQLTSLNQLAKECNCWPACNSITYDAEIIRSQFPLEALSSR